MTVSDAREPVPHRRSRRQDIRLVIARPRLLWPVLNAQLQLRRSAHVPLSVRLLGRAWTAGGGAIDLSERVRIDGRTVRVELVARQQGRIEVGEGTFINYGVSISAHKLVSIGRECQIGQYVIINDNDYHDIEDKRRLPPSSAVVLEDRVWLGARVIVLKGVHIGHDSVAGAGSVVTHDVPPRTIVAGVPATIVRTF